MQQQLLLFFYELDVGMNGSALKGVSSSRAFRMLHHPFTYENFWFFFWNNISRWCWCSAVFCLLFLFQFLMYFLLSAFPISCQRPALHISHLYGIMWNSQIHMNFHKMLCLKFRMNSSAYKNANLDFVSQNLYLNCKFSLFCCVLLCLLWKTYVFLSA